MLIKYSSTALYRNINFWLRKMMWNCSSKLVTLSMTAQYRILIVCYSVAGSKFYWLLSLKFYGVHSACDTQRFFFLEKCTIVSGVLQPDHPVSITCSLFVFINFQSRCFVLTISFIMASAEFPLLVIHDIFLNSSFPWDSRRAWKLI